MAGQVVSIHIARTEGGELEPLSTAELIAGKGIDGDRYCQQAEPTKAAQVSLVEAEQIEAYAEAASYPLQPHETRRNIVTRGIPLNDLVGKHFSIGGVELLGVELAEPCKYLAEILIKQYDLTDIAPQDIVAGLTHRSGLYARIVRGGHIVVGDRVTATDAD